MKISNWLAKPAAYLATCALALTGFAVATAAPANAASDLVELKRPVAAGSTYEADLKKDADFWTLGKMAAAGLNSDGNDEIAPSGGWDELSAPWTDQGLVSRTTGKLLTEYTHTVGGKKVLSACSANVVTSANKSVITSAGHCFKLAGVVMGAVIGDWEATNVAFIPGFNGANLPRDFDNSQPPGTDVAPYGVWPVTRVWMPSNWYYGANWVNGSDVAMAVVDNPYDSRPVEDVTGGQRIGFNQVSNPQTVYQFGYPTDNSRNWYSKGASNGDPSDRRNYDGRTMMYAHGTSFSDKYYYGNDLISAMSPGSSGGPWLKDFDPATGAGVQIGVTSRFSNAQGTIVPTAWLAGPALVSQGFGAVSQAMYEKAQMATTN
ncbi:trypsin-like serine peptidase [Rhodococcus kronopolitis]|uniref:Trypsin-like serine peptidase n=1 Tax=Rhodococcus kronopolitis TaxID=1460226 RepID=A0ABV9FZ60_9NOCA